MMIVVDFTSSYMSVYDANIMQKEMTISEWTFIQKNTESKFK